VLLGPSCLFPTSTNDNIQLYMHVGIPKPLGLCSKINYHFVGSGRGFQQLHNNDNESPSGVGHRKIAKYSSGERESGLSY